jgi:hypothetical protein
MNVEYLMMPGNGLKAYKEQGPAGRPSDVMAVVIGIGYFVCWLKITIETKSSKP